MSAFPKNHRFVTADTMLLVHERKLKKTLELDGSLRACKSLVNDLLAEIESGQALQRKGFEDLVYGSHMTIEDLEAKVMEKQWFLTAQEALALGLIEGVV